MFRLSLIKTTYDQGFYKLSSHHTSQRFYLGQVIWMPFFVKDFGGFLMFCSGGYTRFPNGPTEWCCTPAQEVTTQFQLITWAKEEGGKVWIGRDVDCVNDWHKLSASQRGRCKNKFKAEGLEEELWSADEL